MTNIPERPGFPSPSEVEIPPSCEGWEEMYPYHALFSEDRREFDEGRFWFHDAIHSPEPVHPFDFVWWDYGIAASNQASSRLFAFPPSLGAEYRVLNGFVYLSANTVTDEHMLARRAELFAVRGGHYYRCWDELYEHWVEKVEATITGLELLDVPDLPEYEDETVVTEASGIGSGHRLLVAYDCLLDGLDRIMQYHFELNGLGYWAYSLFYEICGRAFPDISNQTIARMVSGIDLLVLRPDEELKRLARLARELGVAEAVATAPDERALRTALADVEPAARWLADFDETKNPWFYFSNGNGLYHHHRSWIDDTKLPIAAIGAYIRRLEAGEDISRPSAAVLAERERITAEHRTLLAADMRQPFDESLALARTVYPFIENHNFYVEHRFFTIFWNTVRKFGSLLADDAFLTEAEDVFYLRHEEVREALEELRIHWGSSGAGAPRGPAHWPPIVARRKSIHQAMREWTLPPALGRVPQTMTDPVAVMLWGITDERIREWLASLDSAESRRLTGVAGSPGVAEGVARVILRPEQLGELEQGEILVAASTSPSWTPVFGQIAAAVLDSGGIMSHAAIVAREYGLPAVIGTGSGTKRIKTGDRLRVDADTGVVEILASHPGS